MRQCEFHGCKATAQGCVIFMFKIAPGIYPCLPWQWRCRAHEHTGADLVSEEGRKLHNHYRAEFHKREKELRATVEGVGKPWHGLDGVVMSCGISTHSEEEIERMAHAARNLGFEVPYRDIAKDIPIDVVGRRDGARILRERSN